MNNKLREISDIIFYGEFDMPRSKADRMAKEILIVLSESEEEKGCTHAYEKGHCPHDGCPNYHVFVEKPALPEKLQPYIHDLGGTRPYLDEDDLKLNEIIDYLEAQRKQ